MSQLPFGALQLASKKIWNFLCVFLDPISFKGSVITIFESKLILESPSKFYGFFDFGKQSVGKQKEAMWYLFLLSLLPSFTEFFNAKLLSVLSCISLSDSSYFGTHREKIIVPGCFVRYWQWKQHCEEASSKEIFVFSSFQIKFLNQKYVNLGLCELFADSLCLSHYLKSSMFTRSTQLTLLRINGSSPTFSSKDEDW